MRVTVCQLDNRDGYREAAFESLTEHTVQERTDLLVLAEMAFAPWLAAALPPDGARWASAVAAHTAGIAGLMRTGAGSVIGTRPRVADDGSRRNEAFLWTPGGDAVGVHEKYYLPDEPGYWEGTWYDRGEQRFEAFRALDARVGVQICTEMWFFEWARHYARSRVDLLCVPRATPHGSVEKWLSGGQAAAVCAGAYCVSSNLWAPAGDGPDCGGLGWVIDPDGAVLATTSRETPFVTVDIDLKLAHAAKTSYPRYVSE